MIHKKNHLLEQIKYRWMSQNFFYWGHMAWDFRRTYQMSNFHVHVKGKVSIKCIVLYKNWADHHSVYLWLSLNQSGLAKVELRRNLNVWFDAVSARKRRSSKHLISCFFGVVSRYASVCAVNTKPLKGSVVSLKDLFMMCTGWKKEMNKQEKQVTNKKMPKALDEQLNRIFFY